MKKQLSWGNIKLNSYFYVVLTAITLAGVFSYYLNNRVVEMTLQMEVDKGGWVELYVNDLSLPPFRAKLVLNKNNTYHFSSLPGSIRYLRIDPTDAAYAVVKIHELKFYRGKRECKTIAGSELSNWFFTDIQSPQVLDKTFVFKTSGGDPTMAQNQSIYLVPNYLQWHYIFSLILIGGYLLIAALAIKSRDNSAWVPLLVLGIFAGVGNVFALFLKGDGALASAAYAVGNGNYNGYAKSLERMVYLLSVGVSAIIAMVWAYLSRHKNDKLNPPDPVIKPQEKASLLFLSIVLAVFAIGSFPSIHGVYQALGNIRHAADWDSLNNLVWAWETFKGWLPLKDFWYPYGQFYKMFAPFPWDLFRLFMHNLTLFSAFFIAVYFLVNKNKFWTLVILLTGLFASDTGLITAVNRYPISLAAVLLLLVLHRQEKPKKIMYAFFGAFLGCVFIETPDQFIYAMLPISLLGAIHLWQLAEKKNRYIQVGRLVSAGLIFSVVAGVYMMLLARDDQFKGFIDFYSRLGIQTIYCAFPTELGGWYRFHSLPEVIFLYSPVIFFLLGIFHYLRGKEKSGSESWDVWFGIGALGIFLFQKQLVRPHIALQINGIFLFGFLYFIYDWSRRWNSTQKKVGIFLLAFILTLFYEQGVYQRMAKQIYRKLPALGDDFSTLFKSAAEIQKKKEMFFSDSSLEAYGDVAEFKRYYTQNIKTNSNPTFYVLGDQSYFYIIGKQKPPYCICLYSASDIKEQIRLISWLKDNRIEYIVWNSRDNSFDNVPHLVRVPIIYNYILENYEFCNTFSSYEVLRRKEKKSPIDVRFWTTYLGDSIDLGNIPRVSSCQKLEKLSSEDGPLCDEILKIETNGITKDEKRFVRIKGNEHVFRIYFNQHGKGPYYIYLSRVWFWNALKKNALNPEVETDEASGLKIEIIKKKSKNEYLY